MSDDSSTESILTRQFNAHELAALFTEWSGMSPSGHRYINGRLVNSWYDRRKVTGFPEPIDVRLDGYRSRVWDHAEALDWFLSWHPKTGGAPLGNSNGYKTGEYVGVRAKRAS